MLTLSQILSYLYNSSLFFIKKKDLFSLTYPLIFGKSFLELIFFNFVTSKAFKALFTKRSFVKYYFFYHIDIVYINWLLEIVKFTFLSFNITKCYNFFVHPSNIFMFHNDLLFPALVEDFFCINSGIGLTVIIWYLMFYATILITIWI